jgi:hypothetical protein|tara:strand:- start:977 stop:1213 length:237 start_codon:yes stop_codon:yes gene_type:complete
MTFAKFAPQAARILFVIGWVLVIATFVGSISVGSSGFGSSRLVGALLVSLAASLNAAVVPWIGAALIWRADKFLEGSQ